MTSRVFSAIFHNFWKIEKNFAVSSLLPTFNYIGVVSSTDIIATAVVSDNIKSSLLYKVELLKFI